MWLAISLGLGLAACALPIDEPPVDEVTTETEQSLVASNWSAPTSVSASTVWYAQVARVGATTYMVHSGPGNVLKWRQLVGSIWTEPQLIPNRTTGQKVSLASFNGFLYMIHTDLSTTTKLWVSRFSPSTGQWTSPFTIPHTSYGPPALAAFNGKLHLIGVDPGTKKLWQATMTTDEVFSPSSPMEGHYSHSRVSATVFQCKLFIAHRAAGGATVVYNSFDGTQWGWDQTIPAGPGGADIQSFEPVIAERAGYLHLVHRYHGGGFELPIWWTYFNGTSWASEISIPGAQTAYPPAMTSGGAGLVLIETTYYNSLASSLQYTQPLPPFAPGCLVLQPPITSL